MSTHEDPYKLAPLLSARNSLSLTGNWPMTSPCAASPSKACIDLGEGNGHLFEMDITTNRVDAMNHYGIAREAATIYNLPLAPLDVGAACRTAGPKPFPVRIEAPDALRTIYSASAAQT